MSGLVDGWAERLAEEIDTPWSLVAVRAHLAPVVALVAAVEDRIAAVNEARTSPEDRSRDWEALWRRVQAAEQAEEAALRAVLEPTP